MNPSKTAIIVDSGCDVSKQLIQKYDMKQLSLKVIYPEKMYMDGEDIKPQMVYERFPAEIPSTSMANIQDVLDLVDGIREQGYENVIGITISGAMSGTFNSVRLALEEVTDLKTFAFDTKNISIGGGILAIWAARKLEEGMSFDEVVSGLQQKIHDTKLCFYMDTLDYLARGGRITPSVAIVGKVLKLKPIITCNEDGVYYTVAKTRGAARGFNKLVEVEKQYAAKMHGKIWLALMDGGADPKVFAQAKAAMLEAIPDAEVVVERQINASMAIHTGPGLIGICVFAAE